MIHTFKYSISSHAAKHIVSIGHIFVILAIFHFIAKMLNTTTKDKIHILGFSLPTIKQYTGAASFMINNKFLG